MQNTIIPLEEMEEHIGKEIIKTFKTKEVMALSIKLTKSDVREQYIKCLRLVSDRVVSMFDSFTGNDLVEIKITIDGAKRTVKRNVYLGKLK